MDAGVGLKRILVFSGEGAIAHFFVRKSKHNK